MLFQQVPYSSMPSSDNDDADKVPSSQPLSQSHQSHQSHQSRQPPAATVGHQLPATSSSHTSTRKKRNTNTMTQAGIAADDAIMAISQAMEGMEWM